MNKLIWSTQQSAIQYVTALIKKVPRPFFKSNKLFQYLSLQPVSQLVAENKYDCSVRVVGSYYGMYVRVFLIESINGSNFMDFVEAMFDCALQNRFDLIKALTLEYKMVKNTTNVNSTRHASHCVYQLNQFDENVFLPQHRSKLIEVPCKKNLPLLMEIPNRMNFHNSGDQDKIHDLEKQVATLQNSLTQATKLLDDATRRNQILEAREPPIKKIKMDDDSFDLPPYMGEELFDSEFPFLSNECN